MKEITKTIEHLRSGEVAEVDGIPPELWKDGGQHYTQTPCLLLGAGQTSKWSTQCSHRRLVQKQGIKVRLLQLSGDHSALHCRKNPYSCAPKQIGTHHHWRQSTRKSVGSEPTGVPQKWCSSWDSSKRNAGNRTKDCM